MLTTISDITSTTLHCERTTSRILQFFCNDYFENLLAPIAKTFRFLAVVVSKIFVLKMRLQQTATLINIIAT